MKSVIRTGVAIAALIAAGAVARAETSACEGAHAYWRGHYGWRGVQHGWRGVQRHGTMQRYGAMQQRQAAPRGGQATPQAALQGAAQTAQSGISDDQQAQIRDAVKNDSQARVDHVDFGLRVGSAVPRTEHLSALPEDAVANVPRLKGDKFLIDEKDQDIVIVDPRNNRVAAIIPETEGSNSGPAQTAQSAVSDNQQAQIRDKVKDDSQARVDHVNFGLRVGSVVPRSERLAALPKDAVAVVPQFKGYKFLIDQEDRDIVIVDPRNNRVAAIIPDAENTNPENRAGAAENRTNNPGPAEDQGQTTNPSQSR